MPTAEAALHPGWFILLTGVFALVPLILGTTTSYLKISIALGMVRNGFGAQQVPGNTIILVLSLTLSLFIMQPVAERLVSRAEQFSFEQLSPRNLTASLRELSLLLAPWKQFLLAHAGGREIDVLMQLRQVSAPVENGFGPHDLPCSVLVPAFVLTELKEGLMIGFMLLLPFLVIDLAVANILAGLGMYMMSPTIISLPLKLLLFVSVDGWLLISRGMIASYGVVP